ncbi:MAG: hypothetical protein ACRCU2_10155 [Planktothrix sp.]
MDKDNKVQEPIFDIVSIEEVNSSPVPQFKKRLNRHLESANRFAKYCFIYDPSVDVKTGKEKRLFINPRGVPDYYFEHKNGMCNQETILDIFVKIPSLKKLRGQYLEFESRDCSENDYVEQSQKTVTFYTCLAPYRILNSATITDKYLEKYFRNINQPTIQERLGITEQLNTDNNKIADVQKTKRMDSLRARIIDTVETSKLLFYKQYICCEHEEEKGWIVLYRSSKLNFDDFDTDLIGLGANIAEADLNLQSKRANLFLKNMEFNSNILDREVPVNIEQMKKACQKYDKNIEIDSLKHKSVESFDAGEFGFELFCQSEQYKFKVTVYPYSINWTVETDIESISDIPIKASGDTLKEAFEKLVEKHEHLSADTEFIEKELERIHKEEERLDRQESYDDYRWIISEFGSDIFTD